MKGEKMNQLNLNIKKSCLNCGKILNIKIRRDISRKNFCNRKCVSQYYSWFDKEVKFLLSQYKYFTNKELSKILNKTKGSIISKMYRLNVKRTKKEIADILTRKFINSKKKQRNKPWDRKEIILLQKKYNNAYNKDLSLILNRTLSSIENQAFLMGLKKSGSFMINKVGINGKSSLKNKDSMKKWMNKIEFKPNKPEKSIIKIIDSEKIDLEYVGDGSYWIRREKNSFNPDFVNRKEKKIVELFGIYWHTLPKSIVKDKERLKTYNLQGYTTLVIWDYELEEIPSVALKIKNFMKNETPKI